MPWWLYLRKLDFTCCLKFNILIINYYAKKIIILKLNLNLSNWWVLGHILLLQLLILGLLSTKWCSSNANLISLLLLFLKFFCFSYSIPVNFVLFLDMFADLIKLNDITENRKLKNYWNQGKRNWHHKKEEPMPAVKKHPDSSEDSQSV